MTEVGLFLPQMRMDFDTMLERVLAAEEAGFHSVWFMDHLSPPAGIELASFEAWTVAAAVAARTTRIRIGHLVLCGPFRHPALLAKMAASLDVISGGRLELGLGWGSVESELRMFGIGDEPAKVRAAKLAETLEILELLFTGSPVDFAGEYFRLEGAVMQPRPVAGRLPIHIGGAGPSLTLPLVARYADWWNCPSYALDRLDELRPLAGTRARLSVQHPVGLAASLASRDEVVAVAERRFGSWGGLVAGTPDEVAAALQAEAVAGVELCIVGLSDFGRPETIELFGSEVLPALVGVGPRLGGLRPREGSRDAGGGG